MRTLIEFMAEFTTSKDTFTLMAEFQQEINDMAKSREYHKEEHYKLKDEVERLQQELKKRPPLETLQHDLDVKQQVNNQQKEVEQLKQQLAEMTEAHNALTASLKEKETQKILTEAHKIKIFYKNQGDPHWTQIGPGGSEMAPINLKEAWESFRGSDQPLNSDFETVIIDDPQHESHSVRKLNGLSKEDLVKKARRQANEITRLSFEKEKYKEEVRRLQHHLKIKESLEEMPRTHHLLGANPSPEEISSFNRFIEILRTEIYREREDNKNAYRQLATMADRVKELYEFLKKQQKETEAILHPNKSGIPSN